VKRIVGIILVLLMLCACGEAEQSGETSFDSVGESLSESASEDIETETSEEISLEEEQEPPSQEERIKENLLQNMTDFTDGFYPMTDTGIMISPENISITEENGYFSFDMCMEKADGKQTVITLDGVMMGEDRAVCGGFLDADADTWAFCGLHYAAFIDKETLKVTEVTPAFSDIEEDVWINGVMKLDENVAVVATETGSDVDADLEKIKTWFAVYSPEGEMTEKIILEEKAVWEAADYVCPIFAQKMFILNTEEGRILDCGITTVNLDTGKNYYTYVQAAFEADGKKVVIYCYRDEESYELENYIAILWEAGNPVGNIMMGKPNISTGRENEPLDGEFLTDRKVVCTDDYSGMVIELDFEKRESCVTYALEERHLITLLEDSDDGKYSLWTSGDINYGDVFAHNVVLKNNRSGKISYIGPGGGMYGGYGGAGFFMNNDVYNFSSSFMEVFNPESGEKIFDMGKNFYLGRDEKTNVERVLFTFRRDPAEYTYIVVYAESDEWETRHNTPEGVFEHNCNYKLGFLDKEGNLVESYDMGIPVRSTQFGLHTVRMRYSEKQLTFMVRNTGKGYDGFDYVFDMVNHTVTVLDAQ